LLPQDLFSSAFGLAWGLLGLQLGGMTRPLGKCRLRSEGGAPKRFWAGHETEDGPRLLRGEDIDLVRRELVATAVTLSRRRDSVLDAGESGLRPQPAMVSVAVVRLREKIGEQAMDNVLLREKITRLEQNYLWGRREAGPHRFGRIGEFYDAPKLLDAGAWQEMLFRDCSRISSQNPRLAIWNILRN